MPYSPSEIVQQREKVAIMKTRKTIKAILKVALFSVPFILGFIGFADLYKDLWSRLYHTMALFAFSFDAEEEYLQAHSYLQIARLFAGAATFSIVISIVNNFWTTFSSFIQIKIFKAVVVHGESDQAARVLEGLKESGTTAIISNCKICFNAKNQVLAFDSDAEALRYIEAHLKNFFPHGSKKGSKNNIILCSNMYSNSECKRDYLSVYNPAETCARLYWKEHWIDHDRLFNITDKPNIKSVAIVGFDHFGEQLLNQALIMNVTDRQLELSEEDKPIIGKYWDRIKNMQGIDYYVIGSDGSDYCAMHPMLSEFLNINGTDGGHKDSLTFYASLADIGIRMLDSIDLVIIALDDPENCVEMLNAIVCAGLTDDIHIHCAHEDIIYALYQTITKSLTIVPFGMNHVLYSRENLLNEQMELDAKELNYDYLKNFQQKPVDKKREKYLRDEAWAELTYFQRLSNYANCDHNIIKKGLLQQYPYTKNEDTDAANLLMEIEHTRWERFYWLHNWEYNPHRNDAKHQHPCLVPFYKLTRAEQLKDFDMYRKVSDELSKEANS